MSEQKGQRQPQLLPMSRTEADWLDDFQMAGAGERVARHPEPPTDPLGDEWGPVHTIASEEAVAVQMEVELPVARERIHHLWQRRFLEPTGEEGRWIDTQIFIDAQHLLCLLAGSGLMEALEGADLTGEWDKALERVS